MIIIDKNQINWQGNQIGLIKKILIYILKLLLLLAYLISSNFVLYLQINPNFTLYLLNNIFVFLMFVSGYQLRKNYLKPDFSLSSELAKNFAEYVDNEEIVISDKRNEKIIGTLGIVIIPILFSVCYGFLIKSAFIGLIFYLIYFGGLIFAIFLHPMEIEDKGKIDKKNIIVDQKHRGNKFHFETPISNIHKILLFLRPRILWEPDVIIFVILVDNNYYFKSRIEIEKDNPSIAKYEQFKDWLNEKQITSEVCRTYQYLSEYLEDKKEIKKWL